jgi:hypothetical protein
LPQRTADKVSKTFAIASDGASAASGSDGHARRRVSADKDGTRLIAGQPRERRNDGHVHRRRLTKPSSEIEQPVTLLEHDSASDTKAR